MSITIFEFERYVLYSKENVFDNLLTFIGHMRLISDLPIICSIVRISIRKNNRI